MSPWPPLENGIIKVNIDEFFKGNDQGGIRGIFCDANRRILFQFGKLVTVKSIIHAKLLAIRKRLLIANVFEVGMGWFLLVCIRFE